MTRGFYAGHLGDAVDLYVDGTLDAASTRRAARHVLVCAACRREVDTERAIVRGLRTVHLDPERHAWLMADLLALAHQGPQCAQTTDPRGSTDQRTDPPHLHRDGGDPGDGLGGASHHPAGATATIEPWRPPRGAARRSVVTAGLAGVTAAAGTAVGVVVGPANASQLMPPAVTTTLTRVQRWVPGELDAVAARIASQDDAVTNRPSRSGRMDP